MKLLIHSQISTVAPLKFGNGYVISSHSLLRMWLLIHAEIKHFWTPGTRNNTNDAALTVWGIITNPSVVDSDPAKLAKWK